jgi:hypothetical protein
MKPTSSIVKFGSEVCSLDKLCGGTEGCGDKWHPAACSEEEPYCDVDPFAKVYESEDKPGCCVADEDGFSKCRRKIKQCPPKSQCDPSRWPIPSVADRNSGNEGSKDGCGGVCGGGFNPRGSCKTGDMNKLILKNGDGVQVWSWVPERGTLEHPTNRMGPTVFDGMSLIMGPDDEQSVFYDSGVCVGQAPAMKPTLSLTFKKQLFPLAVYGFFDACTSYLFTSDNVGISVVSRPNKKGKPKLTGGDLNGTMHWTIKATWPDQSHWFFGAVPRNFYYDQTDTAESRDSVSPISCAKACGDRPSYFDTYYLHAPQCHCLAPDTSKQYPDSAPRDPRNNAYWLYQQPLDYPEPAAGKPAGPGRNFHTMVYDPGAVTQIPKKPFKDGQFSYVTAKDGDQGLQYLLYFFNPGNDTVTQSACVESSSNKIWMEGNSATSLCPFATLGVKAGGKELAILRIKGGSDPNGFGSTIYVQPFYAPNSVSAPPETTSIDISSFTTDSAAKIAGGVLTVRGSYNGGPPGGKATSKGQWTTTITFTNVDSSEVQAECVTTLSHFSDTDAYDGFNFLQIASNSVRDITCDSELRLSDLQGPGDGQENMCFYPSNKKRFLPDLTCDETCQVKCQLPGHSLPPHHGPSLPPHHGPSLPPHHGPSLPPRWPPGPPPNVDPKSSHIALYISLGAAGLLLLLILIVSMK